MPNLILWLISFPKMYTMNVNDVLCINGSKVIIISQHQPWAPITPIALPSKYSVATLYLIRESQGDPTASNQSSKQLKVVTHYTGYMSSSSEVAVCSFEDETVK